MSDLLTLATTIASTTATLQTDVTAAITAAQTDHKSLSDQVTAISNQLASIQGADATQIKALQDSVTALQGQLTDTPAAITALQGVSDALNAIDASVKPAPATPPAS